ncbi:hypothetical protein KCP78_23720 [Salmonella enterica subsp. enterica]|nr:hypothetical protein KCP78_23720 [Salmonella enterica subsp. enterica]
MSCGLPGVPAGRLERRMLSEMSATELRVGLFTSGCRAFSDVCDGCAVCPRRRQH